MNQTNLWIRIAYCRDIPLREGRAVKIGSREIAVFNLGNRFLAVENRCPHKGGPLADGIVSGTTVVCPLHAWKMNLETGKGANGPSASSCIETFPTRVEGGVVLIEVIDNRKPAEAQGDHDLTATCTHCSEIAAMNDFSTATEA